MGKNKQSIPSMTKERIIHVYVSKSMKRSKIICTRVVPKQCLKEQLKTKRLWLYCIPWAT